MEPSIPRSPEVKQLSREVLPNEEFTRLLTTFERTMFRLETKAEYNVPSERWILEPFKRGELLPTEQPPGWKQWFSRIQQLTESGREVSRVHSVPQCLGTYLRYEIEWCYPNFNVPSGEKVKIFLDPKGKLGEDFYLFDEKHAVIVVYNSDASFKELLIERDNKEVERLVNLAADLQASAIPLSEFLLMMRNSTLILP